MKTIYLAHCYSDPSPAQMHLNRAEAAAWACWIHQHFNVAVSCSWIVMVEGIAETPETRALGMDANAELIAQCCELWLIGPRRSAGMEGERGLAEANKVDVRDFVGMTREQIVAEVAKLWGTR